MKSSGRKAKDDDPVSGRAEGSGMNRTPAPRRLRKEEVSAVDSLARAYFEELVGKMARSPAIEEAVRRMKP